MKNKVLIELIVPEVDQKFNLFIPVNKKVGNIIVLLNKSVADLTNGLYNGTSATGIYDRTTGKKYNINDIVRNTDIRNGSSLILI